MTLDQAEAAGVLEALVRGANIEAATSTLQPLTLSLPNRRGAIVRVAPMTNGDRGRASVFLAPGRGALTIELTDRAVVKLRGKRLKARRNDAKPPRTRVKVRQRGGRYLLRFRVEDASPTTTYAKLGRKVRRVKRGRLRVSAKRLRKGIRYQSVDALGNTEKTKRLRRR